jgi:hypothetical protein
VVATEQDWLQASMAPEAEATDQRSRVPSQKIVTSRRVLGMRSSRDTRMGVWPA